MRMPGSFTALFNLLCLWLPITSKNVVSVQVLYRKKMICFKESFKRWICDNEIKPITSICFISYNFLHTKIVKKVNKTPHICLAISYILAENFCKYIFAYKAYDITNYKFGKFQAPDTEEHNENIQHGQLLFDVA